MRKPIFALAGLALIASGAFASVATVSGADHRDSPMNTANPTSDINDVYAFRSPENPNNLVVVLSTNPAITAAEALTRGVYDPNVQYQIHVDRTGDLQDEATVNIRVTGSPPQLTIEGLGGPITAPITPPGSTPMVYNKDGVKVFAGLRDDPFFFDLSGFQAFLANPQAPAAGLRPASGGPPQDFFAGFNVLATVIELPVTAVTGAANANTGTIKAWVSSTRGGARIDRMAIPAINTALIPSAQKDNFNLASPIDDAATYRKTATDTIVSLRGTVDKLFGGNSMTEGGGPLGNLSPEAVAGALIPDVVTIDFSKPVQFPNGRRLQDDVIDVALGLVLNRGGAAGFSDGVSANDKPFGASFPYLADPNIAGGGALAAASGAAPAVAGGAPSIAGGAPASAAAAAQAVAIRAPNTGDAGLASHRDTMWALSGGLFALALTLGTAGVFAAARKHSR